MEPIIRKIIKLIFEFMSLNLFLNWQIGHLIVAEFERSISADEVDEFVSILDKEEQLKDTTRLEGLSDVHKIQYGLRKSLIQRYFGTINGKPIEINSNMGKFLFLQ